MSQDKPLTLLRKVYKNPTPTVDAILIFYNRIVLIKRKNEPFGWALPGGFVDYGESCETACLREIKEEVNLDLTPFEITQFKCYSEPDRDPRGHNISIVFYNITLNAFTDEYVKQLRSGDDAKAVRLFSISDLPENIAFDHRKIIDDFIDFKNLPQ